MSARHVEIRFLKKFGLRLLETRILGLVGTLNALSLKEICRESDIEKSHASRLIARLQERGLMEKTGDEKDQRSIVVRLTEQGYAMHRLLYAESLERNQRWLSVLGPDEQQQLLDSVEKLIGRTRAMLEADAAGLEVSEAPLPTGSPEPIELDRDLAQRFFNALSQSLQAGAGGNR